MVDRRIISEKVDTVEVLAKCSAILFGQAMM
jgi:hypothetical protein